MLETAVQLESDPPDTETSASVKLVEASERVKVIVAVSPALREQLLAVRAILGLTLSSTVIARVCITSTLR